MECLHALRMCVAGGLGVKCGILMKLLHNNEIIPLLQGIVILAKFYVWGWLSVAVDRVLVVEE